jgi:hypothetical protein
MKFNPIKYNFFLLLFLLLCISSTYGQNVKEGLQNYETVFSELDFRQLNVGTIIYLADNDNTLQFLSKEGVKHKKYWFNKKHWSNKSKKDYKKTRMYEHDETILLDRGNKRSTNAQVYYFDKITSNSIINSKKPILKFIAKTEDNFSNPQELFSICKLHVRKGNRLFNLKPRRCIYKHGVFGLKNYGPYPNFVNATFENIEYIPFNAVKYLKNGCLITVSLPDLVPGEYCIQNSQSMEYQLFTIK